MFSRKDGRNKLVAIHLYEHAFEPQEGSSRTSRKQVTEPDQEASFDRQRRAVGSGNSNPDAEESGAALCQCQKPFPRLRQLLLLLILILLILLILLQSCLKRDEGGVQSLKESLKEERKNMICILDLPPSPSSL